MFCAEWALVKIQFRTATVLPLKCKCWTCDECRPGRTKRLVEEAKSGKPTIFITLTSRKRASLTASQAAVLLAHAWRQVRHEYIREHGKGSLAFLAVFEETKRGWPRKPNAAGRTCTSSPAASTSAKNGSRAEWEPCMIAPSSMSARSTGSARLQRT